MNVNRIIQVRDGETLHALREFLAAWWRRYALEALLAPVEVPARSTVVTQVIEDPLELAAVNPFAPVMLGNAAASIGEVARRYAGRHVAALLRPCELRTLIELRQQGRLPAEADAIIILGVDCLGTFPVDGYAQRVQARGIQAVTREALAYADEGGLSPQAFRTACQICTWPAPRGADLTLGVLGTNSGEYLLLIARDEATDARLELDAVTAGLATESQVVRREVAVGAVAAQRAKTRAHLGGATHDGQRFDDLGRVLSWFATCSLCGDCLDACPLYNGELSGLLGVHGARPPLAELVQVSRWLATCSGCGMCEVACGQNVPLMRLISSLSYQIQGALQHTPGDPARPLPWTSG
jgi:formate dehydrogenase subunit beta